MNPLPGDELQPQDLEALARSGIPPDLARQALLRRVASIEGALLVGRKDGADYAGVTFPYIWPGDDHVRDWRLRRDHPDLEYDREGKPKERAKYVSPPGRSNMLYLVPGTMADWLGDASLPVVLTEGEKKTLALWTLGWHALGDAADRLRFLPVGLGGVWNWRGTIGKATGPAGDRRDVKGVIPDFDRLQWKDRKATILFDANVRDNEKVRAAQWSLIHELQRRGAKVFRFQWPTDTPKEVNGIDDLVGLWGPERVLDLVKQALAVKLTLVDQASSAREFVSMAEDRYKLTLPGIGIMFEIDRLRRDRHELVGELSVRCELPGAHTVNGSLSIADFNVSSARARSERAKLLAERSNAQTLDWAGLMEEFCQRVLQADRAGQPAIDLRQLPKPGPDDSIVVDGFTFPRRHPTIIFGDGGTAKSYTALYVAGHLAERGMAVALFDWELAGDDHRERLERLFGNNMPLITYARCERPLVFEADRLCRIVRENSIEFAVFDSIAFACDGPPEAAEVAGRYFRAVRQIGCGSLHAAHISKAEGADKKPFGSTFWHNGARSTWYVKLADTLVDTSVLNVGFFNRKANLGRLCSPVAFTITFTDDRTTFRRTDVAESPDLAAQLSIRQRMVYLLRKGAMTPEAIAEELEANAESVRRVARGHKTVFTTIEGGRLALLDRTAP